jgi:hypothetical protein
MKKIINRILTSLGIAMIAFVLLMSCSISQDNKKADVETTEVEATEVVETEAPTTEAVKETKSYHKNEIIYCINETLKLGYCSRKNMIEAILINYPDVDRKQAEEYVDDSGVDWNGQAAIAIVYYFTYGGYSDDEAEAVYAELLDDGFTNKEITTAAERVENAF